MPTLNLTLKSPSVGTFPVEIEDDETVEALAVVAYSLKPELGEDLRLVYKGKVLKPELELKQAGVESGAAIAVARKVSGPQATSATVVAPKTAAPMEVSATAAASPKAADNLAGAVHLTGFGPFAGHNVNASWEVARQLGRSFPSLEVSGRQYAVHLPEGPVQVAYAAIDGHASAGHYGAMTGPNLPIRLVVHVGVGRDGPMRLESRARNSGYAMPDVCGQICGDAGACVQGGPPGLQTSLDLSKICAEAQAGGCPAELQISSDAGLYLCEYIFYKSLHTALCSGGQGPAVLFVHVPPLGQPYSLEQLVASLRAVLRACLEQATATPSAPSAPPAATTGKVPAAAATVSAASALRASPKVGDRLLAVRDHTGLPCKWQKGDSFLVDSVKTNGFVRLRASGDSDRIVGVLLHLWGDYFRCAEASQVPKVKRVCQESAPSAVADKSVHVLPSSPALASADVEGNKFEEVSTPMSMPATPASPTSGAAIIDAEEMPITSESLLGAAHLLETGELSPAEAAKLMRRTAMQVEEFKQALGEMGQALQMVNFVSARTLRNIGVPAQDAGSGGAGPAMPSQPAEREEPSRSFLLKKGDADVQEMHRRANEPKFERNISSGSGSTCNWGGTASSSVGVAEKPKTKEEMDKAREDRLKRLEAQQEQKKKQMAEADEKAKSRDALFNKPFVGPTKQIGEH